MVWTSRANSLQRKGRAGRVTSGVAFHMFTHHRFEHIMRPQPVPEIHRSVIITLWIQRNGTIASPSEFWERVIKYHVQYDGSNDYLDRRIDFRFLNFVCIIKYLRSRIIKGCFIEWKCLRLLNFNLRLDLIKTSFFKVLTYLNRSSGKFYMVLKKKIS